jgi:acyl-homoserine-lactone acylase
MKKADKNDGYETWHNNRSQRIAELVTGNKIDYEYFKKIKFDRQLPKTLRFTYKIDSFLLIRPEDHPAISDVIRTFQKWDRRADATSEGAAVFILIYDYVSRNIRDNRSRQLTIKEGLASFQYAHDHMMKYFGKTGLPLGDIQKLVRGTDARPVGGLPDVLTAAYTVPYKNGMRKINSGDAYICFVRYPKDGRLPLIESVNVFGASMDPQSPHYKDQLPLFLEQRTKKMTLDKAEVLRTAERVYHPG